MTRILRLALILSTLGIPLRAQTPPAPIVKCEPAGTLIPLPGIAEASGLGASLQVPGRFWTHADSKRPMLYALDSAGAISGRVEIQNARINDWEAIAPGRCATGSCLYIGDIGDNNHERQNITVYRVPDPPVKLPASLSAEVFRAVYPDRPHDAEAMFFANDRLYIVTKGDGEAVRLYAFPRELRSDASTTLERIGSARPGGKPHSGEKISDAAVSPDGKWIVLRSNESITIYRTSDLLAGRWTDAGEVDLRSIGEPQGEGVAIGTDGKIYLAGEAGKDKSQPGTFARLSCSWPK